MKKLILLSLLNFVTVTIFGQGGTWTWISGSNILNANGVYGTQGIPSVNNRPPANYEYCEWKDKQGNFWIYGGTYTQLSDLWKFNPTTLEWTWIKGSILQGETPVYGTKGVANSQNTPGSRSYGTITWTDTTGNLWLFAGNNTLDACDLWKYEINTNCWTWVSGNSGYSSGIYGVKGIPSTLNYPGSRSETCSGWTDSLNNLWLYGGVEPDNYGFLSDMWKYNINTNEWAWMAGFNTINNFPIYGTKGISNATNEPGGRYTYTKWIDSKGDFWIFGGGIRKSADSLGEKGDLWKYQINVNEWVWMHGSSIDNFGGTYNSICIVDSLNEPKARREHRASITDNCSRFWMLGGFSDSATIKDLWMFDSQQMQWVLLSGSNLSNQSGNYGSLGVPSLTNTPPSRAGSNAWWGNNGKFYFFGGMNISINVYCDMWVFEPDTSCLNLNCSNTAVAIPNFSSSDSLFCEKKCINFFDISQNNPTSWQWTFSGANPSTSTDQNPTNICYNNYGSYNVTLIACNQYGCDTLTQNNFITSYITPHDSIWFVNDTLFALPAYSYQWYQVGVGLIANATLNYYVPQQPGSYYCNTKDSDGCEATSNVILYTSFFENENSEIANAIWPSPANEIIFINPELLKTNNITFEMYDMHGRIILREVLHTNSITISQFASSVYSYRIITKEKIVAQGRFVKQK